MLQLRVALAIAALTAATSNVRVAHGAACTSENVAAADALITQNTALFQSCLVDLKSISGASSTSFIASEYTNADKAATICASENCVKALIVAMETLSDCCSPAGSNGVATVTNLPRLADDILHQCDVIDAAQLSADLEKEIEKLPDLKVQIKSVAATNGTSSGSSSSTGNATAGDVDVVIDVKKREIMKDGNAISSNTNDDGLIGNEASSAVAMARASHAALAMAALAVMVVII
uniref:Elicitin-like protein n=1 Tax=Globisporangium ultimum (strain ATCC 200006 / CBS 805.95 / DAOM BR144) TaxID=431595 RepID=K3WFY0_GLOUD